MNYGEFVKQNREAAGMRRYRLWKMTGIGESTIKFWEEGKVVPTVDKLDKVLKALGASILIGADK